MPHRCTDRRSQPVPDRRPVGVRRGFRHGLSDPRRCPRCRRNRSRTRQTARAGPRGGDIHTAGPARAPRSCRRPKAPRSLGHPLDEAEREEARALVAASPGISAAYEIARDYASAAAAAAARLGDGLIPKAFVEFGYNVVDDLQESTTRVLAPSWNQRQLRPQVLRIL